MVIMKVQDCTMSGISISLKWLPDASNAVSDPQCCNSLPPSSVKGNRTMPVLNSQFVGTLASRPISDGWGGSWISSTGAVDRGTASIT